MAPSVIMAAGTAPSIHNTQPWRFSVSDNGSVGLYGELDRLLWVADPFSRAMHISCGAALFNLRLGIRMSGLDTSVWLRPRPATDPALLAVVRVTSGEPATAGAHSLFGALWRRRTSRMPFSADRIPYGVLIQLREAARAESATFRMLPAYESSLVLRLAGDATHALAANPDHRTELERWVAGDRKTDGVPRSALAQRPSKTPAPVRDLGYTLAGARQPDGDYEAQPQLAVLTTGGDEPSDWLSAGQALQRVLLTATAHGLSTSLLYQPLELRDMGLTPWWPWTGFPQMIIRLGYGPAVPPTPRRPLEDLLADGPMPNVDGAPWAEGLAGL